jgi:ribosome-binding factor A
MKRSRVSIIKHSQKESFLLREISQFFTQIALDYPELQRLYITRVSLAPDRSMCTVYFHTAEGQAGFKEKLPKLILFKPSLRSAIAKVYHGPYAPDLVFRYDDQFDKGRKVDDLIEALKSEGKL